MTPLAHMIWETGWRRAVNSPRRRLGGALQAFWWRPGGAPLASCRRSTGAVEALLRRRGGALQVPCRRPSGTSFVAIACGCSRASLLHNHCGHTNVELCAHCRTHTRKAQNRLATGADGWTAPTLFLQSKRAFCFSVCMVPCKRVTRGSRLLPLSCVLDCQALYRRQRRDIHTL